jgi:hypothetical protein
MLQMSVNRQYGLDVIHAIALSSAERLHTWLGGRWSLVFSHPEDFASHGFEADRWESCLSEDLERLDLAVIATGAGFRRSWISRVGGRFIPSQEMDDLLPADWQLSPDEHFVTILDGGMRPRRTIVYAAGVVVPSPIELAQAAAGLRARQSGGLPRQLTGFCSASSSPRARASRP